MPQSKPSPPHPLGMRLSHDMSVQRSNNLPRSRHMVDPPVVRSNSGVCGPAAKLRHRLKHLRWCCCSKVVELLAENTHCSWDVPVGAGRKFAPQNMLMCVVQQGARRRASRTLPEQGPVRQGQDLDKNGKIHRCGHTFASNN